jgi:hypothetical protein
VKSPWLANLIAINFIDTVDYKGCRTGKRLLTRVGEGIQGRYFEVVEMVFSFAA